MLLKTECLLKSLMFDCPLTPSFDQFKIYLSSSWLDFFWIFKKLHSFILSKSWYNIILHKIDFFSYLVKKDPKIVDFVFFKNFPENCMERKLLWYLTLHSKFYVWQNSSSWVIAQYALGQTDCMISESSISHKWVNKLTIRLELVWNDWKWPKYFKMICNTSTGCNLVKFSLYTDTELCKQRVLCMKSLLSVRFSLLWSVSEVTLPYDLGTDWA